MVKVVVLGGGVAGISAALASARRGAETTLIESSKRAGAAKSLFPSLLSGTVGAEDMLLPEAGLLKTQGVDVRTGATVASVDDKQKRVRLESPQRASIAYDRLVICTGSSGEAPQLRGLSKRNAFVLREDSDYLKLSSALDELGTLAVSGPVPLALKIAEILAGRGKSVQVYCGRDGLSLQFSGPVARAIRNQASRKGERVRLLDASIESILGVERVEAITSGGLVTTCDAVVVVPKNVPSFPHVGCERGRYGGLLVDFSMSTSVPGTYAAGDCAEFRFKSGSVPARLQSTSRMGGEVAGINAAGGHAKAAPSWAVEEVYFGVEFSSAGLTEDEAKALGLRAATEVRKASGGEQAFVSMVYDADTHQIYGVQVAGPGALSVSSAVSLIVSLGVTVDQLLHAESPYRPGSGYEFSPIALTARKIAEPKQS